MMLDVRDKMYKDKKLQKKYPKDKHKYETDKVINRQLYIIKAHEYQKKEETINKWMLDDAKVQKKYDSAVAPNIKCEHCGRKLQEMHRDFEGTEYLITPMTFTLICNDCRNIKHVYENGEVIEPTPERCSKCKAIVTSDCTFTDDISTCFYKCTKCGHSEKDVHDHKQFTREMDERERKDKELLEKYRDMFCLKEEEGNTASDILEQMKFANEVYKFEIQKYNDPAREQSYQVKKLDINELEKVLNKKLIPEGYRKLNFGRVVIEKFVTVPFSIQNADSEMGKEQSIRFFVEAVTTLIENTNWRLMKDDTTYRLGYLSGSFKGYERDEDILKLFKPKEESKRKELDPDKMSKYGFSGLVKLAKLTADYEGKEILRKKKLKDCPDGYFLEAEGDNSFRCSICNHWHKGVDIWYDENGMRCDICQRNIKAGVISAKLCNENESWFSSENIHYKYGVVASTMRKLIRLGELKGKELKDREGKSYLSVFLKNENWEFLEKYPEKESGIPATFEDEQGREIRL